jgi:hypothetical protein
LFGLLASVLLGSVLLPGSAVAQEKNYEEWLEQQRQEYEKHLNEQDKAFLNFLKKEWENVQIDTPTSTPLDNKPRTIPRFDGDAAPSIDNDPAAPEQEDRTAEDAPPDASTEDPGSEAEDLLDDSDLSSQEESSFPDEELEEAVNEAEEDRSEDNSSGESSAPDEADAKDPASEEPAPNRSTPSPSNPPAPEEESEAAEVNQEASLSFFGTTTAIPYGSALLPSISGAPDKFSIRSFWKSMAKGPHGPTLKAAQQHREDLGLDDWGYYRYLRDLSTRLYGDAEANEPVLWTWFMMIKSGYGARVGYREGQVILMLPVEEKIFGQPQMHIGGQRYYLMTDEVGRSLRTYEGQHEEASRALDLSARSLPDLPEESETRTVSFSFQDERHKLEVAYNPSVVDYLRDYPNTDLQVLFEAGLSSVARGSVTGALRPLVEDLSPRASLNLLLKFAQFATDYKRDQDHFGEERYLFPEETLASDYSDCEDRAVLMAYLTRELLDRKVVGLRWPNHVALAVRAGNDLTPTEKDRTVSVDGATYIFADPTYIGSNLGMEMPVIEGEKPELISLRQ